MVFKIKNKYKKKHIDILLEKNLIIAEEDREKFETYLVIYGNQTIINDFKRPFVYGSNNDMFLKNINCLSIIELFNFDRESSNYILKNILDVEHRLANAVFIMIEESLANKKGIENYDGLILKEDIKTFNNIFSKFRSMDRKRIIMFLEFVNKSQLNKNKYVKDLIYEFENNISIKEQGIKIDRNLLKLFFEIDYELLTFENENLQYIFEENWLDKVKDKFDKLQFEEVRKLLLNDFKKNKKENINKIENLTLEILSKNWTLGNLIKIFKSLDPNIKSNVLQYMFEDNYFYVGKNFVNEFIEIITIMKMVRNRICHNEPIYNFETTCHNIHNFLQENSITIEVKNYRSKVNIYVVIDCLILFDKFSQEINKKNVKDLILDAFNKIVKTEWNEKSLKYIKRRFFGN